MDAAGWAVVDLSPRSSISLVKALLPREAASGKRLAFGGQGRAFEPAIWDAHDLTWMSFDFLEVIVRGQAGAEQTGVRVPP